MRKTCQTCGGRGEVGTPDPVDPRDDQTDADAGWLRSKGFTEAAAGGTASFLAPDDDFPIRVDVAADGPPLSLWCCGKEVCPLPTRGQVTSLVLGLCLDFPDGTGP